VQSLDSHLVHFVGDHMLAIAGQAIDTSKYKKMSGGFACLAKKFIDIALAVGHVNASFRGIKKFCRLAKVRQLSYAFFSMGTRVGLIFFLSALQPLNFFLEVLPVSPPGLNALESHRQ
jgi:hypothetical protein